MTKKKKSHIFPNSSSAWGKICKEAALGLTLKSAHFKVEKHCLSDSADICYACNFIHLFLHETLVGHKLEDWSVCNSNKNM